MALIASGSNKEFKQVPEGSHMARCYRVIDLGTQRWDYQGEPQIGRKVLIGWELFGEDDAGNPMTTDDGHQLTIFKKYTLSLGKKANLRADLESWRGRAFTEAELNGFDIGQLLGVYCMVTVKHAKVGEKTYANVASVTKWPSALKGQQPKPANDNQFFDVTDRQMAVFEVLPEWIQKQIKESAEWSGSQQPMKQAQARPATGFDDMDDDIPF
jgi:hypothetical protein